MPSNKRKVSSSTNTVDAKRGKYTDHWSSGLLSAMADPEYVVASESRTVVIKDRYPKAEFHYLVLPRENINSLKSVKPEHLELLKHMHDVGDKLIKNDIHEGKTFRMGYHAEASMDRLHLHVISDDMNSPSLKTKKHWNSFTTDFFLRSESMLDFIECFYTNVFGEIVNFPYLVGS